MERIERSDGCGLEQGGACADRLADLDHAELRYDFVGLLRQVRRDASYGTHDLHFDDRARDLVRIAGEELPQRFTLRLLDDELDQRRGVDVDQSRSSRSS
jgi:hypothetical protein